jgi:hypothetical protein
MTFEIWDNELFLYSVYTLAEADEAIAAGFEVLTFDTATYSQHDVI